MSLTYIRGPVHQTITRGEEYNWPVHRKRETDFVDWKVRHQEQTVNIHPPLKTVQRSFLNVYKTKYAQVSVELSEFHALSISGHKKERSKFSPKLHELLLVRMHKHGYEILNHCIQKCSPY